MDWYQIVHTVLAVILAVPLVVTAISWIKGVCSQEKRRGILYSIMSSVLLILYVILLTLNDQYGPRIQMNQIFSGIPFFYYFSLLSHNLLDFFICLIILVFQSRCIEKQ